MRLVYAKRYEPELVIDVATLNGSASAAIGPYALVAMGTASDEIKKQLNSKAENMFLNVLLNFLYGTIMANLLNQILLKLKMLAAKVRVPLLPVNFWNILQNIPGYILTLQGLLSTKNAIVIAEKGEVAIVCDCFIISFANLVDRIKFNNQYI